MANITTFSGKHMDPTKPRQEDIEARDIAHALSLLCRANGHVKHFYSVGQHSITCYYEAKARGYSKKVQVACLLHDGSEAYLSDVTRPVKAHLPQYLPIEEKLQDVIWMKYLGEALSKEEVRQVFEVDDDILALEFKELMPIELSDQYKRIVSKPVIAFRNPSDVEEEMYQLLSFYV